MQVQIKICCHTYIIHLLCVFLNCCLCQERYECFLLGFADAPTSLRAAFPRSANSLHIHSYQFTGPQNGTPCYDRTASHITSRHNASCIPAQGSARLCFVGPAPEDKLPKDATPGRLLTGSLTLAKLSGAAGNGDAPGAPTITYVVCASPN